MSSTFWINEPNILIDFKQPLLPSNTLSCEENMNAITTLLEILLQKTNHLSVLVKLMYQAVAVIHFE